MGAQKRGRVARLWTASCQFRKEYNNKNVDIIIHHRPWKKEHYYSEAEQEGILIHGGDEESRRGGDGGVGERKGGQYLVNNEELLAVHIHLKDDTAHLSGERRLRPQSHEL